MLQQSDYPLASAERLIAPLGLTPAYISPTPTGLKKSIIDATDGVRDLLRRSGFHDFGAQPQGPGAKVVRDIDVYHAGGCLHSQISLYRPETKHGDPRLWISRLATVAVANNLIGLVVIQGRLVAFVLSHSAVRDAVTDEQSPLRRALSSGSPALVASEAGSRLLTELRQIAASGWIPAVRHGDTAVGMTLEACLGIAPNSSQAPDYSGFELKAKVLKEGERSADDSTTRQTLFACVPDWDISRLKQSRQILAEYGYTDASGHSRRRLYCEVSTKKVNSQGLKFEVDHVTGQLVEVHDSSTTNREVARWKRATLEKKLLSKHTQTAWVYARTKLIDNVPHFRYFQVTMTAAPRSEAFLNLLESGIISMDHLIKQDLSGKVSEKGPLFKIHSRDFSTLFPYQRAAALDVA